MYMPISTHLYIHTCTYKQFILITEQRETNIIQHTKCGEKQNVYSRKHIIQA